jgi:3-isopropylmalate/(R)-2-methylmalate dehydratase large subunit
MSTGRTIAEKILARAARREVRAGEIAICEPEVAMGTDGSIPMALDYLAAMQIAPASPRFPERLIFALDHYGPTSGAKAAALQARARDYAHRHGILLWDVGDGIGHQRPIETGHALPGRLVVGADSHATSYGAMNAFGTGIGSSDLAGLMLCGQIWVKAPRSIRVVLNGTLGPEASAKDLALVLARRLGADGANYRALEFAGPGVATLDIDDRIVLANMSVEIGAKAGLFPFDDVLAAYLAGRAQGPYQPTDPDADAVYEVTIEVDLAEIVPQIALPHQVDNVVDLSTVASTRVDMVYLGTCTGGRVKDYQEALEMLRAGGGVAQGVKLVVTPASGAIRDELERSGLLAEFAALGADIQPPGCGACCGTGGTIPADGMRIISTANRNFKGRMGNANAAIYLASPRACALAAVRGSFGDEEARA